MNGDRQVEVDAPSELFLEYFFLLLQVCFVPIQVYTYFPDSAINTFTEPAYIWKTAEKVAQTYGLTLEETVETTRINALKLFKIENKQIS